MSRVAASKASAHTQIPGLPYEVRGFLFAFDRRPGQVFSKARLSQLFRRKTCLGERESGCRSWRRHVFLSFFGERRAWVSENRAGSHGGGTSFSAFSEKDVPGRARIGLPLMAAARLSQLFRRKTCLGEQESRRFSWQRHVFLSFFGERRACYCFRALEAPTFCKQNLCFAFLSFSPCLAGKHEW